MPNLEKMTERATVEADLVVWLAVHGALCLALRHPDMKPGAGAVRDLIIGMVAELEQILADRGALSAEEITLVHQVEAEAHAFIETDYPPHPQVAAQMGIPGNDQCVCPTAAQATFCLFGHMLECHYPLTCEQAQCSHYRAARTADEPVT